MSQVRDQQCLENVEKSEFTLEGEFVSCLPKLRKFVSSKVSRVQDQDDIVQETLARAIRSSRNHKIQNPLAYSYTVAKTVMIDYWRKHRLQEELTFNDDEGAVDRLAANEDTEKRQLDIEKLEYLQTLLDSMPRLRREVFIQRRLDGKSRQAIAESLGISEESVKKHISRAMVDIAIGMEVKGW